MNAIVESDNERGVRKKRFGKNGLIIIYDSDVWEKCTIRMMLKV